MPNTVANKKSVLFGFAFIDKSLPANLCDFGVSLSREKLRWEAKMDLNDLVKILIETDVKKVIEKGY